MAYYTYRIRVTNHDRVQVEKWDAQHQDKGQPSGAFRYQQNLAEIAPRLQAARNNELNDSTVVRSLGEALFDVLFDDVLRQDFVNFYNEVVHQKKQLLRVELDIDEQGMPEIAALPWEFMCVPARANLGTIWMGTLPNLAFSRWRSQWIPAQPIQLAPNEKLRIALVISAPSDLSPVAYEPVQTALEQLAIEQANRVELLPIVSSASPREINNILLREPHIFHFIGHGRMTNNGGEVALVDPNFKEAIWEDADDFSGLFNTHRPSLVMLQACEGGMLSSSQAFVGVASKIVQQNVPVVVAMQYEVTNSTACCFALGFYQQLVAKKPVDIAAQYGREEISLDSTRYRKRDFATPVIFMRVQDGHLFDWTESLPPSPPDTTNPPGQSRVLVVDDFPNWQNNMKEQLSSHYEVHLASTCQQARDLLNVLSFDLIIVDRNLDNEIPMNLGDGMGLSLLKYVRDKFPKMARILISGADIDINLAAQNYFRPYGLFEILIKNKFEPAVLVAVVEKAINETRVGTP